MSGTRGCAEPEICKRGDRTTGRAGFVGLGVLLYVMYFGPALAQGWTFDGSELARFAADYERLRDSGEATNDPSLAARVAYFNGFVLGVARANADRGWYCLPTEAVAGQAWDAVATFLREHPEFLDRRPSTLVNGALTKGFPCAERPAPAKKPAAKPKPKPSAGAKPSR